MRISDWSSDVCSSDLHRDHRLRGRRASDATDQPRADLSTAAEAAETGSGAWYGRCCDATLRCAVAATGTGAAPRRRTATGAGGGGPRKAGRSEEHTSELQSLMRISYAVFCLKKKNRSKHQIPI